MVGQHAADEVAADQLPVAGRSLGETVRRERTSAARACRVQERLKARPPVRTGARPERVEHGLFARGHGYPAKGLEGQQK